MVAFHSISFQTVPHLETDVTPLAVKLITIGDTPSKAVHGAFDALDTSNKGFDIYKILFFRFEAYLRGGDVCCRIVFSTIFSGF
jgi:hypothetical protein